MKLADLAQAIGVELRGNPAQEIAGVAPLERAGDRQLGFLSSPKYRRFLTETQAGAIILAPDDLPVDFTGNVLLTRNPYAAFARAVQLLHPERMPEPGIHHTVLLDRGIELPLSVRIDGHAVIGREVVLGERVWIGGGVSIGEGCSIGDDTRIHPNAVLYPGTRVGARCIIHGGAVLGADGFGFAPEEGRYLKIPQLGRLVLGDDVEIGANTTVDRGALDDTVIEDGVKIDNLVQIGHNVRIGAHTVIAGQTGIAGSTRIGKHCVLGGQVGVAGHLEISDGVIFSGKSQVTRGIRQAGIYSSGDSVRPNAEWRRQVARLHRLDELFRRLEALEARLAQTASGEVDHLENKGTNN